MGITKVWITDDCIACGSCESVCPEVFEVFDKSTVKKDADFKANEDGIKEAAKLCPASAIKFS